MKKATEHLVKEHELILILLSILDGMRRKLRAGEAVPVEHLEKIAAYLELVVVELHHAKEEEILFPALDRIGLPVGGGPLCILFKDQQMARMEEIIKIEKFLPPSHGVEKIGAASPLHVVLKEHQEGHYYRNQLKEACDMMKRGSSQGRDLFHDAAWEFHQLLREHIEKENRCLFVMADEILNDEAQEKLEKELQEKQTQIIAPHRWPLIEDEIIQLKNLYSPVL